MRILIVEDHILFQESLGRLLDAQPDVSVVAGATSVFDAVVKARQLRPDVILMDFTLPDGTGVDATKAILAEQPSIKIVFLTIHEEDDMIFEAIRNGAMGYLPKNVSSTHLLSYLRGLERGEVALQPEYTARILKEFAHLSPRGEITAETRSRLTVRQREILQELKTGATNRQIAARLVISEQTVKNHVSRILKKLNLKSRHELS
ncbi:MAG TPA: response regulator transcription factor [Anaerolineales bacterium]|nr:response regulator transcription factor [Anaerolineales bacterium]